MPKSPTFGSSTLSFLMPEETKIRLYEEAQKNETCLSAYVRKVIRDHLQDLDEEREARRQRRRRK